MPSSAADDAVPISSAIAPSFSGEELPAVTVPPVLKADGSAASRSAVVSGTHRLVPGHALDGHHVVVVQALVPCLVGELVAAQGPGVLLVAPDAELGRDPLGAGTQGVRPVAWEARVDHAPAHRRLVHLHRLGQRLVRLRYDVRRPAHALDATRDHVTGVADRESPRSLHDGLSAGGAQPVDRAPRNRHRKVGEQGRHPADVAVLLAGAVRVAVDHVVDLGRVQRRVAAGPARAGGAPPGRPCGRRTGRRGSARTGCGRRRGCRRPYVAILTVETGV